MTSHDVVLGESKWTVTLPGDTPPGEESPTFTPDSFQSWKGRRVHVPGLDPARTHVLAGVAVAADQRSAVLTVHTHREVGDDLVAHLGRSVDTPPAHVRVVDDTDGTVLLENLLTAPLVDGQRVRVNGDLGTVVATSWPHRHPEHGSVQADERGDYPTDWQEARMTFHPAPQVTLADSAPGVGG